MKTSICKSSYQRQMPQNRNAFLFCPAFTAELTGGGIYYVKQMSSIDMVVLKSSYLKMTQPYLTRSFFLRFCWEKRERWNLNIRENVIWYHYTK